MRTYIRRKSANSHDQVCTVRRDFAPRARAASGERQHPPTTTTTTASMLRALSATRPPAPTAARAFSTSASAAGGHRVRKTHNALKEQRWVREQARRPNPVLGTRPGEEWKWDKCDLAKILVLEKDFASIPVTEARHKEQLPVGEVEMPQQFAYGVHNEEKKVLFRYLPYLSATTEVLVRGLPYFLIQSLTEPTVDHERERPEEGRSDQGRRGCRVAEEPELRKAH